MKEQDFDHTSCEGFGGAIEGWDGCVDEGVAVTAASIEGWGLQSLTASNACLF